MVRSHSYKTVKHIQPSKTGVKTNINMMKDFEKMISGKNLLKKINKIKAATAD